MIEFAVVSPSFNNEYWLMDHVSSVLGQTYPHWRLYYIDDASDDATGELIDIFAAKEEAQGKIQVIHNTTRKGSLANFYSVVHALSPNQVVVCLDGDDHLAHSHVLERLATLYQNQNIWLTYGSFETVPSLNPRRITPYSLKVLNERLFRKEPFQATHLKSFYAKLFQSIKKEDLLYSGMFFPVCGDLAFMLPMLEMASRGHVHFVEEVLYTYNVGNPLNDVKINRKLAEDMSQYIRHAPKYEPLFCLFDEEPFGYI